MNKPQAVEYTTQAGHKVTLSDRDQLIVEQGYPCINGGRVKHNGKSVRLVVRYDNKPELAEMVAEWLAGLNAYEAWFAGLVEETKQNMVLDNATKFNKAENDEFSWTYWDGTNGNTLRDKLNGNREIYQMKYTDTFDVIVGEKKQKVMAFWRALDAIKDDIKADAKAKAEAWANSPEGKAETRAWKQHEKLMREMDRADSDY